MKNLILLIAFSLVTTALYSQQKFSLSSCDVQIAGTSTLHDWTADVEKTTGSAVLEISDGKLTNISSILVNMDANSIKSSKGSMMDKNMYKALKTDEFPDLTFRLVKLNSSEKKGELYNININGKLTVAGTTQSIDLAASGKIASNGNLVFSGSKTLKMTDYNVEPPELFFGSLKTADEITIIFEASFKSNGASLK